MVSTRPLISNSSCPCTNPCGIYWARQLQLLSQSLWCYVFYCHYYNNSYYFTPRKFFAPALADGLSLSDSTSLHVPRTLLSILADLNNTGVWIVPIHSFKLFNSPVKSFQTAASSPITIDITVLFMFHSFLSFLARSKNVSFFSLSLIFISVFFFFFFVNYH